MNKFGIYPRNKGRKRFKTEGMFKNLFKNIACFQFSGSILESKRVFVVRMVKWGCSYHSRNSRTNSKNSLSKPWEIEHFSSFVPIFLLPLNP